jgi:hypothetical protein
MNHFSVEFMELGQHDAIFFHDAYPHFYDGMQVRHLLGKHVAAGSRTAQGAQDRLIRKLVSCSRYRVRSVPGTESEGLF